MLTYNTYTCTAVHVYDIFLQNKVTCCVVYTLCIKFFFTIYMYIQYVYAILVNMKQNGYSDQTETLQ